MVPEAYDPVAFRFEKGASGIVVSLTIRPAMLISIDLDDQLATVVGEVGKIGPDRHLPSEVAIDVDQSQLRPQTTLVWRGLAS